MANRAEQKRQKQNRLTGKGPRQAAIIRVQLTIQIVAGRK